MTWAVSSAKPLSEAAVYAIGRQVEEWAANGPTKPIILQEGMVLHDLSTGRSYGAHVEVTMPGRVMALCFAAGAAIGFVVGVLPFVS